jgi:hypothetical protein
MFKYLAVLLKKGFVFENRENIKVLLMITSSTDGDSIDNIQEVNEDEG